MHAQGKKKKELAWKNLVSVKVMIQKIGVVAAFAAFYNIFRLHLQIVLRCSYESFNEQSSSFSLHL